MPNPEYFSPRPRTSECLLHSTTMQYMIPMTLSGVIAGGGERLCRPPLRPHERPAVNCPS